MSGSFAPFEDTTREYRERLMHQAEQERLARSAGMIHGWFDPALWAAVLGPLVGLSFLGYFAQEVVRAIVRT